MNSSDPKMIPLRIRLPYGSEDEFIEKYGSNVARGGIFIATRAIKPEGTPLSFEFVLQDGSRLFRGEGVVVKTQVDEGGTRSGMTVRFTKLDSRSKALVDQVIASRTLGATPPPPASEGKSPPAAPSKPPAPPAPAPPKKLPRADDVVLGIDLGTTNSRVAIYVDGAAKLIPVGQDGKGFALPSVVAVDEKGRFLVGARAKALVVADPKNTVFGAKRLLGRRARSRKVRELAPHFPYAVVPIRRATRGSSCGGRRTGCPSSRRGCSRS